MRLPILSPMLKLLSDLTIEVSLTIFRGGDYSLLIRLSWRWRAAWLSIFWKPMPPMLSIRWRGGKADDSQLIKLSDLLKSRDWYYDVSTLLKAVGALYCCRVGWFILPNWFPCTGNDLESSRGGLAIRIDLISNTGYYISSSDIILEDNSASLALL
jgi:hypothetical protein